MVPTKRGAEGGECAEVGIVKITADVYAFMLSYCRRGFTDVYADLRFVLSAGTHCPRNYYSAVAAAFRHPRPANQTCSCLPFTFHLEISNFDKFSVLYFYWKTIGT